MPVDMCDSNAVWLSPSCNGMYITGVMWRLASRISERGAHLKE